MSKRPPSSGDSNWQGPSRARTAASPASLPFPHTSQPDDPRHPPPLAVVWLQKEDCALSRFENFDLDSALMRGITDLGFEEPTPIQIAALPPGLAGRDVLACAMTGSGKTAAFVLPILQQMAGTDGGRTRALIVTPTRELASQIHEHIGALARHTPVKSATVFGGVKPGRQEKALRSGVDIVVATPGRLLDLMQNPWARFEHPRRGDT